MKDMKEKNLDLNSLKRRNIKRFIFFVLFFIITLLVSTYLFRISVKFDNNKIIKYTEKSNLDYKVYLLKNDFYETEYLGKNMLYVSNLIDKIVIDFNYKFESDENENIDFEYNVIGTLSIDGNTDTKKSYFTKNYTILDKRVVSLNNEKSKEIKEQIVIDYPYYNVLANNFRNQYGVEANSKLSVNLFVNKINKNDKAVMDSVSTMNIAIPLTLRTVNINLDYNDLNETNLILEKEGIKPTNIIIFASSIVLFLLSLLSIFKIFKYLKLLIKKKSPYDKYVSKLLKEYDRLIAESSTPMSFKNKEEIKINKFTELLDIHDNLQLPIMYYSVIDHQESYFYICHDNVVYVHSVNANDMEKKK